MLGDGVDLIGVVVPAAAPGHAWAGAVPVGLDRDEPVALGPEREDLCFHSPALHTPLWRNTTGLPVPCSRTLTRRPRGVGSVVAATISVGQFPAGPAGFLEEAKLPGRRAPRDVMERSLAGGRPQRSDEARERFGSSRRGDGGEGARGV